MRKYIYCVLLLVLSMYCKAEKTFAATSANDHDEKVLVNNIDTINSIDKDAIGTKISEEKRIKLLKTILKKSFERDVEKPYMWDIFVGANDTLLHFFSYKDYQLNGLVLAAYYVEADYEDADYTCLLLVNEATDKEYNSLIVYERLLAEENYERYTCVLEDKLNLMVKTAKATRNMQFQIKEGLFLDYMELDTVDRNWGNKESVEYQQKGGTKNHLKNGYWIEKRYAVEYGKSVIQDGHYINGLRDGDWNYAPDGPVDKVLTYANGRCLRTSYP